MKQFRKLIIENFQSHEYTEIDFVPGLNVFVGPSDSGKSAILRALRWVLFNQPRGGDFIRSGAKRCEVRLRLDDGTEIVRIRSKSINRYILRTPDGAEEVYESLGSGAHPMVVQAHQMMPLTWDQKETVIQLGMQLDGPFLLSESGGSKAKLIGRISGAHWIDLALKDTTRERNQLLGEMKRVEKQQTTVDEKLAPYESVPQLEQDLAIAKQAYAQAQQHQKRLDSLRSLAEQLQSVQTERQAQAAIVAQFDHLPELELAQARNEQRYHRWHKLQKAAQQWLETKSAIAKYQQQLQQTEALAEIEIAYIHIAEQRTRLREFTQQAERLQRNQLAKDKIERRLATLAQLPKLMEDYEELTADRLRLQQMQKLSASLASVQAAKYTINRVMQATTDAMHWSETKLGAFEQRWTRYGQLLDVAARYENNEKRLIVGREYLQVQLTEMVALAKSYTELLKESGKCPICGTTVDSSLLEHLEQELDGGANYAAVGRADEGNETKTGKSKNHAL